MQSPTRKIVAEREKDRVVMVSHYGFRWLMRLSDPKQELGPLYWDSQNLQEEQLIGKNFHSGSE